MSVSSVHGATILAGIDSRCPCIESDLCLVRSNYQTFQAFQEAAPQCSDASKVRCCSEQMMLLSLIEIQNRKSPMKPRQGRTEKFVDKNLPCTAASECEEIYGTKAFHFIHITPQTACSNRDLVRCVVTQIKQESSLPCQEVTKCKEIFGTKSEHFSKYGFMTGCQNTGFVRCIKSNDGENEGTISMPTTTTTTTTTTTEKVFGPCNTDGAPALDSIVITSSPIICSTPSPVVTSSEPVVVTSSGTTPDLMSIVITSSPTKSTLFPVPITTTFRPTTKPELNSTVICSTPGCRKGENGKENIEVIGENEESGQIVIDNASKTPSVQIIGPRPVYFQVTDVRGPVIGDAAATRSQKEELKILLKLARDRLKAYIEGKRR